MQPWITYIILEKREGGTFDGSLLETETYQMSFREITGESGSSSTLLLRSHLTELQNLAKFISQFRAGEVELVHADYYYVPCLQSLKQP